jgi:hypothetical protein
MRTSSLAPVLAGLVAAPLLLAGPAAPAAEPLFAREPFAKAKVHYMARAEKDGEVKLAELEVWAEGTRLRARFAPGPGAPAGELWVDGFTAAPLLLRAGKVESARRYTLEHGLSLALQAAPALANSGNDRVAGRPCKLVTEELKGGLTMTRCLWRGLPLSVELSGRGFSFNAAATSVEEGAVTVADLQPPPGAPAAAPGLSAGR